MCQIAECGNLVPKEVFRYADGVSGGLVTQPVIENLVLLCTKELARLVKKGRLRLNPLG